MKANTSDNFFAELSTGLSDGCLVLVTVATGFFSYQIYLASAVGY